MQVQKIFIITPLGNKNSEARKHADRMWNEVFVPVSEKISTNDLKVEFERSDLMDEGSNSRVKKIMELIRESVRWKNRFLIPIKYSKKMSLFISICFVEKIWNMKRYLRIFLM